MHLRCWFGQSKFNLCCRLYKWFNIVVLIINFFNIKKLLCIKDLTFAIRHKIWLNCEENQQWDKWILTKYHWYYYKSMDITAYNNVKSKKIKERNVKNLLIFVKNDWILQMTFSGFTFDKKYVIINRNFNRWQSVILLKTWFFKRK